MPFIAPGHVITLPHKVKKILVCQLRQIGDVLLATPAIELLQRRFPDVAIHVFTEKKCAPMLEHNPDVANIWMVDKKELKHLGRELLFYRQVARERFDLVVDFQQLPRCRWVAAFSRARVRLTYPPKWYNRPWYTHWHEMANGYSAMYRASLLRPLGIRWNGERPRLYLSDAEREWASGYLDELGVGDGELLAVAPTHRRYTRQWPPEYYGQALAQVLQKKMGLGVVLFCGPGEESVLHQVREAMAPELRDRAFIPEGILSLREMAAVIERASLLLGNCSAPRHLAVAVDTPSLAIHGATRESAWTYPGRGHEALGADLSCRPCNSNRCDHPDKGMDEFPPCLREIAPEMVSARVLERLG